MGARAGIIFKEGDKIFDFYSHNGANHLEQIALDLEENFPYESIAEGKEDDWSKLEGINSYLIAKDDAWSYTNVEGLLTEGTYGNQAILLYDLNVKKSHYLDYNWASHQETQKEFINQLFDNLHSPEREVKGFYTKKAFLRMLPDTLTSSQNDWTQLPYSLSKLKEMINTHNWEGDFKEVIMNHIEDTYLTTVIDENVFYNQVLGTKLEEQEFDLNILQHNFLNASSNAPIIVVNGSLENINNEEAKDIIRTSLSTINSNNVDITNLINSSLRDLELLDVSGMDWYIEPLRVFIDSLEQKISNLDDIPTNEKDALIDIFYTTMKNFISDETEFSFYAANVLNIEESNVGNMTLEGIKDMLVGYIHYDSPILKQNNCQIRNSRFCEVNVNLTNFVVDLNSNFSKSPPKELLT